MPPLDGLRDRSVRGLPDPDGLSDRERAWRAARVNAISASPVPPITMRITPIESGVVPSGPSAWEVPVVPKSMAAARTARTCTSLSSTGNPAGRLVR